VRGFEDALPIVLAHEGGFVDHPMDRGGPTNCGITQATYDTWREDRGQPTRSVRELETDERAAIYLARYWLPANCQEMPWPISLLHFDAAVNHGLGRPRSHPRGSKTGANHLLQRALGVDDDGIIGPLTLAAVRRTDPALLARDMILERLDFYRAIVAARPDQLVFLVGWLARGLGLRKQLSR